MMKIIPAKNYLFQPRWDSNQHTIATFYNYTFFWLELENIQIGNFEIPASVRYEELSAMGV